MPVTRPLLSVRSPVIRSFQRIALLVARVVLRQPSQSRVAWSIIIGLRMFIELPVDHLFFALFCVILM